MDDLNGLYGGPVAWAFAREPVHRPLRIVPHRQPPGAVRRKPIAVDRIEEAGVSSVIAVHSVGQRQQALEGRGAGLQDQHAGVEPVRREYVRASSEVYVEIEQLGLRQWSVRA